MNKSFLGFFIAIGCAILSSTLFASNYVKPNPGDSIIGDIRFIPAMKGDSPSSIAQRYSLGTNAIVAANPGISEDSRFANGTYVKVPTQFLLPSLPHQGIIINLPEMRMYYFPKDSDSVMTFPIGIGKIGKTIPITNTAITRKVVNPVWIPTKSIREFNEQQGIELPYAMPPGPDNPLGPYAIYMKVPTYLIHSTIFPESIGRRASFGCIRMNEGDIKQFFPLVTPGTPVAIIDMPYKIGWEGDRLFLEAHPPLEERGAPSLPELAQIINSAIPKDQTIVIDWQMVAYLAEQPDGVPHQIGFRPEG
jgi:L,D-transpeptidase ErfK/SrfK